jgi:hypothetical protein
MTSGKMGLIELHEDDVCTDAALGMVTSWLQMPFLVLCIGFSIIGYRQLLLCKFLALFSLYLK